VTATKTWTRWQPWNEIARAAVILGIVPDISKASMMHLSDILRKRVEDGSVQKRKAGTAQSAKAEYRAKRRQRADGVVMHTTPAGNQLVFHPQGGGPFADCGGL
jgi:hypothetical protein